MPKEQKVTYKCHWWKEGSEMVCRKASAGRGIPEVTSGSFHSKLAGQ
jgi:hypothetical protein